MKKTYKIEVDCANCALKMEEAARKVDGVSEVTVSFMTQKMKVEFADGAEEKGVMQAVRKACKKVEDDCEIFLDSLRRFLFMRRPAYGILLLMQHAAFAERIFM